MKKVILSRRIAALGVGMFVFALSCGAATTNQVPWAESFESYTNGLDVNGTNGWWADASGAGVVTTNPAVVSLLTNYPSPGVRSLPVSSTTHDKVLRLQRQIRNETSSLTGEVVKVDFMAMPVPFATVPPGDPLQQFAFYVSTNGHLVIWHRNTTGGSPGVNEWLELAGGLINTGAWSRFTVKQDYTRNRYQVSVNEGAPLTNAAGWTVGGAPNGSWFDMVQTNGVMTRFRFGEDATNYVDDVVVDFGDPAVLSYSTNVFAEALNNDGSVNGPTVTLANKAFNATNGEDMVLNGKVTYAHLPAGLGLQIFRGLTAQDATLVFTAFAPSNSLADSITNLTITFTDTAFVLGNAASVMNFSLTNLHIQFMDPRVVNWGGASFSEISGGAIDNRTPMTITLSGEAFAGTNGEDFYASGKITQTALPAGLTPQVIRDSATHLTVRLMGNAALHGIGNNVSNVVLALQNTAFARGSAIYVENYQQTGIKVLFVDDTGFFNVMPYVEPFEGYANGFLISGTNGWSADFPDSAQVTNDSVVNLLLNAYQSGHDTLPVATNHTKVLRVQDTIRTELHSETAPLAYLDFMAIPVPMQLPVDINTNRQYAFYVSTNQQLVLWHRNMTGGTPGVNEWLTLTNEVSTSQWVRFTVAQDYAKHMFQIRINEGAPVQSEFGWAAGGLMQTGSWFYMVQTNSFMTRFKVSGTGNGYVDDLTLRVAPPAFTLGHGSIFTIR